MKRSTKEKPERVEAIARPVVIAIVIFILAAFTALALASAWNSTPTSDEPVHLLSGYTYLTTADLRINPEHPPLVKVLAAFPLLFDTTWPQAIDAPTQEDRLDAQIASDRLLQQWNLALLDRSKLQAMAHTFFYGFRDRAHERYATSDVRSMPTEVRYSKGDFLNDPGAMIRKTRIFPLLIALILAILVFAWASELFGSVGGMVALILIAFDPNFIAHGALVTTDVGAAAFGFGTIYFFWRTMRRLSWLNVVTTGLFLGLALITKFSSVLLVPMIFLLAFARWRNSEPWISDLTFGTTKVRGLGVAIVFIGLISYAVLWAGYGFRYAAVADREEASKRELSAHGRLTDEQRSSMARRAESAAGTFPLIEILRWDAAQRRALEKTAGPFSWDLARAEMPYVQIDPFGRLLITLDRLHIFPEAYTFGFAFTRQSTIVRDAFLRGEYDERGFASYFLWTALYKIPLPILLTVIAGLIAAWRRRSDDGADTLYLIVPALLFLFILLRSNINIGHRHSLPLYPFLYTLAGGLSLTWLKYEKRRVIAALFIIAVVSSSLFVFAPPWKPQLVMGQHLAYFNELAGGPRRGHEKLIDSNLDWGQDLERLSIWARVNRIKEPINLNFFGIADPRYYGIAHRNLFLGYEFEHEQPFDRAFLPGYVAISANNLQGVMYDAEARRSWNEFLSRGELVARPGYSLFVYRLK